jgi:hypothetical protein
VAVANVTSPDNIESNRLPRVAIHPCIGPWHGSDGSRRAEADVLQARQDRLRLHSISARVHAGDPPVKLNRHDLAGLQRG